MTKNTVISKSSFLTKKKLNKEFVELEDGMGIFIREMSGADVELLAKESNGENKPTNIQALAMIIALSACDEEGNSLFTMEDVPAIIENNSIAILVKLSDKAVQLSNISSNAINEAKNNLKNV
jgi:hypothetical protein